MKNEIVLFLLIMKVDNFAELFFNFKWWKTKPRIGGKNEC